MHCSLVGNFQLKAAKHCREMWTQPSPAHKLDFPHHPRHWLTPSSLHTASGKHNEGPLTTQLLSPLNRRAWENVPQDSPTASSRCYQAVELTSDALWMNFLIFQSTLLQPLHILHLHFPCSCNTIFCIVLIFSLYWMYYDYTYVLYVLYSWMVWFALIAIINEYASPAICISVVTMANLV